jgi:hypothetical protein
MPSSSSSSSSLVVVVVEDTTVPLTFIMVVIRIFNDVSSPPFESSCFSSFQGTTFMFAASFALGY